MNKFKNGDLVIVNEMGRIYNYTKKGSVGIVVNDRIFKSISVEQQKSIKVEFHSLSIDIRSMSINLPQVYEVSVKCLDILSQTEKFKPVVRYEDLVL